MLHAFFLQYAAYVSFSAAVKAVAHGWAFVTTEFHELRFSQTGTFCGLSWFRADGQEAVWIT